MSQFFADLWASLQIFYSNFNARWGALVNAVVVLVLLGGTLIFLAICRPARETAERKLFLQDRPRHGGTGSGK